jgi:hypothetical protein
VAVFLVTFAGSQSTTEVHAEHYFTQGERVTFWSKGDHLLPEPVAQFDRSAIAHIVEKTDRSA